MTQLDSNTEIVVRCETAEQRISFEKWMATYGTESFLEYNNIMSPVRGGMVKEVHIELVDVDSDITCIYLNTEG